MNDFCLCKHGRDAHAMGFGGCLVCVPKGKPHADRPFVCRPGACDRFTWDPKGEEEPAKPARKGGR